MTIRIFPPCFLRLEFAGIRCHIPGASCVPLGVPLKYRSLSPSRRSIFPRGMFPNLLVLIFFGTGTGIAWPLGNRVPPLIWRFMYSACVILPWPFPNLFDRNPTFATSFFLVDFSTWTPRFVYEVTRSRWMSNPSWSVLRTSNAVAFSALEVAKGICFRWMRFSDLVSSLISERISICIHAIGGNYALSLSSAKYQIVSKSSANAFADLWNVYVFVYVNVYVFVYVITCEAWRSDSRYSVVSCMGALARIVLVPRTDREELCDKFARVLQAWPKDYALVASSISIRIRRCESAPYTILVAL